MKPRTLGDAAAQSRRPFRCVLLCPIDNCTWETDADPDADQPVRYQIEGPGDLSEAIERAVAKVTGERARRLDAILRTHLESHDVLDWMRTVRGLEQQIGQYDSGIRPHMPSRPTRYPRQGERVRVAFEGEILPEST